MVAKDSKSDRSLRYSIIDGVFAALMSGFTLDYFTPFLLVLGGTVTDVGLLNAVPNFFSAIIQLKSADISERYASRKKVITFFILLQALMLLPMVFTYMLGSLKVAVFIATVTLFTSFGAFIAPAWGSLMADLVLEDKRGEYFGWRNKVVGFVTIIATFAAGFILYSVGRHSILWGFAAIFAAAFAFRMVSWRYLGKMHERTVVLKKEDYFSIVDFIARFRHSNFARFVFFVSCIRFAANISAPFFAVLMLRDLKFNYLTYTAINLAATLATNFTIKRWGIQSDKIGNLKVLKVTALLVSVNPLLWLINQNPYFLFCAQLFAGFTWAGFNLSASNFIYDAATPGKLTRCIAYFNVFNGIALCLGALLGGAIAFKLPAGYFKYGIMNIILISSLLRLIIALVPFRLKEVRKVDDIRNHELLMSMVRIKSGRQSDK